MGGEGWKLNVAFAGNHYQGIAYAILQQTNGYVVDVLWA